MNAIYHQVRKYMLGKKARLVAKESHRKRGRLLDIGTGTGYFAATMEQRGWKVEAIEKMLRHVCLPKSTSDWK